MDVPRIPPVTPIDPGTPAAGDHSAGGGDPPFEAGQRLFARVLQAMADGRALLDVGGERLLASTPVPVRAGDILAVVVRTLEPVVELDVETPPVAFSERAYALAAVRQALQQARPSAPLTAAEIDVLAGVLERAGPAGRAPAAPAHERLLALVRPLTVERDAAALAGALRERVAHGGLSFEAHAAKALAGDARALVAELQADVRWLLAALAREAEARPGLEPLVQRLVDDVSRRQLETAQARIRDGDVRLDLPLLFGQQQAQARLVITDPPAREAEGERGPAGRTIALTVSHPELGPIDATVRWAEGGRAGDLHVRFGVRDEAVAATLSRAVDELGARLRAVGFRHVSVAVAVDPDAGAPRDPGPDEPPPGGSIVSALA
jgi:hypothetical protein